MSLAEGDLLVRGAEDPYALSTDTTLTGTSDTETGAITAATLDVPTVSFTRDITTPLAARVYIDANFTMAAPAVGAIDPAGNVVVTARLTVHLHVEVGPSNGGPDRFLFADCQAAPIVLALSSTAPYDPGTGRVTLANDDFTVPPVNPAAAGCGSTIGDPINEELAGSGHSLRLTLDGDLTLPPLPGDPSITTLTVDPAGGSRLGDPVTLTATVVPGEDAETTETPVGFVDFLDGTRLLDSVALEPDGTATLTTSTLSIATHTLRVRYRGQDPYRASEDTLSYTVAATPLITTDLPDHLTIAATPTEFDLTVANTHLGTDITNTRIGITIRRTRGSGYLAADRMILEHLVGETWEPVTLTNLGGLSGATGTVGPTTGFPLPAGAQVTDRLRLAFPTAGLPLATSSCSGAHETCPGPITVIFQVLSVDPGTGEQGATLAQADKGFTLVEAERRTSTPTFLLGGALPRTVRQGSTVEMLVRFGSQLSGIGATGPVTVAVDGVPVPVRAANVPLEDGYLPFFTMPNGTAGPQFLLPPDARLGTRQVTVSYSGDAYFKPAQITTDITVLPAQGVAYDCQANVSISDRLRFGAHIIASAHVPTLRPAGSTIDLDALQVRLTTTRLNSSAAMFYGITNNAVTTAGPGFLDALGFGFGPGGSGSATAAQRTGGTRQPTAPYPALEAEVDQVLDFQGETGTVTLNGQPGDRVPVTLDTLTIDAHLAGAFPIPQATRCTPVGEPLSLGEVTLTGVDLAVASEADPVRADDEVTLTATVAPTMAGTVEFRDGDRSVGVVPVDEAGVASTEVTFDAGSRSIVARFYGGTAMPTLDSEAVPISVLPAVDCAPFATDGNAAVVRLVYMELLGRCPDQAGFDHWKARLDGGTSPEAFARIIARTPEAVGTVVDDAYQTMLGRAADPTGRTFWINRLLTTGRYDRLLADLGASGEFWTKAGSTNEGFVTRVYDRLLNRAPDQAGLAHWTARLDAGAPRGNLIRTIATLDEPLGRLVTLSYDEILDRTPTPSERTRGITHLRTTGDRSGLYAQLIGRPEFTTRAQDFPNPED
ncbi:MAG TPA: Ig-like domain repeat protein [Acidimicrobiales bacterium]|nr:Ig-like domain repeat protein [Acidimicrobiales bacterium]